MTTPLLYEVKPSDGGKKLLITIEGGTPTDTIATSVAEIDNVAGALQLVEAANSMLRATEAVRAEWERAQAAHVSARAAMPPDKLLTVNGRTNINPGLLAQQLLRGPFTQLEIQLAAHVIMQLIAEPIPMVLHCPACGLQHIDRPEPGWSNPPHRSHRCRVSDGGCGLEWRPSDWPTTGVLQVLSAGANDLPSLAIASWSQVERLRDLLNEVREGFTRDDDLPNNVLQRIDAELAAPPLSERDATCIACCCTDSQACVGGCSWLAVDRVARKGVCSNCRHALKGWQNQLARRESNGADAAANAEPSELDIETQIGRG